MPAPEIIQVLVKRFADNISYYKSKNYNEAQLRQEFLDPFFEALGWDIYNKKDYAPRYREVIVEKPISFLGSQASKTPDYTFRLGEDPKFFVEAKRPSENLQTSSEFAFQLKAYAWNKHLPLSILTDFEEFLVFDCRRKPTKADRPDVDCVMKLAFTDYIEKWDELISIFSPVSIRKGAFDKYAEDNTSKKGVSEVDDEFLKDISNWRELLARNIALRNQSNMDESNLNYAVQMTIDRIIFLRICEDRGIEPFNQLRELADKPEIYQNLKDLFKRAELKYNSGLFTFNNHKKEHNTHQDNLTPTLAIDDKVLKQIITGFYYPASTYNFKAIPVEILGQVYEQFLGKVIRLTPGHQAKIEEKPEVRKAGGVYYTPKYIVDYIVANTVGKLLEGKTPDQVSQLRIVDPACGSGSFLLGAFQYLMDWHEEYYLAHDPQQWVRGKEPALAPLGGDEYRLSTPEKKRILINNIYGVDIDAQAVEVTKLSLLLKVLEEETGQLSLGLEHALPDLGNNIKCGNSLIGWDYFEGQLIPDEKEVKRINPFNWQDAFPEVFAKGGFDAVIGNPPYIKEYSNRQPFHDLKGTKLEKYYQGKMDLWYIFACLAIDILSESGLNGFIATNNWITNSGASILRKKLLKETEILEFTDFGEYHIFRSAGIQTMVYVLRKKKPKDDFMISYKRINQSDISEVDLQNFLNGNEIQDWFTSFNVKQSSLSSNGNPFTFYLEYDSIVLTKLDQPQYYKLDNDEVAQGIVLPQESVLEKHLSIIKNKNIKIGDGIFLLTEEELTILNLSDVEKAIIKPYYTSKQLDRYYSNSYNELWLIYTDKNVIKQISKFPTIKSHLDKFGRVITSDNKPYGLHRPRDERFFLGEKIISIRKTDKPKFSFVDFSCYVTQTFYLIKPKTINLKYLLGILNSKVVLYWLQKKGKKQGNALQIDKEPLINIPIRIIDSTNPAEVKKYDQMVSLVEHMLELHKRTPQTPHEQEMLQREIASTDAQIDRLVYELYGLTEEEIKIVEGNV